MMINFSIKKWEFGIKEFVFFYCKRIRVNKLFIDDKF